MGHVLLSVLVFTGMFTAYTYLADILGRLAGIPSAHVGWWLIFAAALNISGANVGIGLGALVGGRVINGCGLAPLGDVAAGVIVLAMLAAMAAARSRSAAAVAAPGKTSGAGLRQAFVVAHFADLNVHHVAGARIGGVALCRPAGPHALG